MTRQQSIGGSNFYAGSYTHILLYPYESYTHEYIPPLPCGLVGCLIRPTNLTRVHDHQTHARPI